MSRGHPPKKGAGKPAPTSAQWFKMADTMQQAARESMEEFKRTGDSEFYNLAAMEELRARQLRDQAKLCKGGEAKASGAAGQVAQRHQYWVKRATALISAGKLKREIAAIVAREVSVDPRTVRTVLRKADFC